MKDNSEDTVQTHMLGLSKIYEHRGPPYIESQLEGCLLRGCLPLTVSQQEHTVSVQQESISAILMHHSRLSHATTVTLLVSGLRRDGSMFFGASETSKSHLDENGSSITGAYMHLQLHYLPTVPSSSLP